MHLMVWKVILTQACLLHIVNHTTNHVCVLCFTPTQINEWKAAAEQAATVAEAARAHADHLEVEPRRLLALVGVGWWV